MDTITKEHLQIYFSLSQAHSMDMDMNRLACGSYANYHTQVAFHNFCNGFNSCLRHFAGDGK